MPYSYDKFEPLRTLAQIDAAIYTRLQPLHVEAWLTPEPVPFAQKTSGEHRDLTLGQAWGKLWDCAWMHITGEVPASARGQKVVLLIDFNGEGLVYDESGTAVLGLTTVRSDFDLSLGWPGKRVVEVSDKAKGGETVDLWLDAGANDLFGKLPENGVLREAHVAICHEAMRSLFHDYFVLQELILQLPETSARRARILKALYDVSKVLNTYSDDEAKAARKILAPELAKVGGTPSLTVSAVGHAHIDLGWLWPIRETIRKGGRTFATAVAMLDRYPDYVFGASQAQLYQWVKDYYPGVYSKVKQKIADGRWEIQGGMWVEADVNVSGGEALVRQFVYGKRFWREEFGKDTRMLWLPDVFGYNGALPQIMKKSEIDYFMTIKISWSKFNTFPHHTFIWEGIDGSRVLAHMPPEGTYNSAAAPRSIAAIEREYRDKYVSDRALLLYGIGDGGGGPGESHLENLARMKNLEGLPPVMQEPAENFFHRLEPNIDQYKTWAGELYLEYHQGTLTTQARNKRFNRKLEYALRELEWLGVWASSAAGYTYPTSALEAIWKEMLLYQFHDILPGSSITRVYTESLARYQILMDQTKQLTEAARSALIAQIDTSGRQHPVVVTNSLSWECKQWLKVGETWIKAHVPAMGYAALELEDALIETENLHADAQALENELLRVQFAADGSVSSVYDKVHKREVLPSNSFANTLDVYDDDGNAWDFAFDYRTQTPKRFELVNAQATIDGPRAVLHQSYRFGDSTLSQQIILTLGSRRLDFVTEVDWQENGKMLRTRFPLDIHAWEATCDIQFGTIKRPTHSNTTWDMAKYEIAAHKWVDLSQRDYGVALMNDCKYGYHVEEGLIDLNLLRSPHSPDPVADRAHHSFTYSLFPHQGDHIEGNVAHAAYMLNIPMQATLTDAHTGKLPASASLIKVDAPNIIVEAVKQAEDGAGMVVRLYEMQGASASAHVSFNAAAKSVELTNLLEASIAPLEVTDNSVEVDFHPFEIQTVKVK